jgi:hypothetical protein
MNFRCLLVIGLSVLTFSRTMGGFVAQDTPKPHAPGHPSHADVEGEKALPGRLVAELERSSRSFMYLRSVGFTQSDEEFEQLIAQKELHYRRTSRSSTGVHIGLAITRKRELDFIFSRFIRQQVRNPANS